MMKTLRLITRVLFILTALLILAGITVPKFLNQVNRSDFDLLYSKTKAIRTAIYAYKVNTGSLPRTLGDLLICPEGLEGWAGPYLKENDLYDPTGKKFVYDPNTYDLKNFKIISYGADGLPGGKGYNKDVYND